MLPRRTLCLAISEPTAASDVAALKAVAKREGDEYVVSGQKKWISGGMDGDYFLTVVRTGGPGTPARN